MVAIPQPLLTAPALPPLLPHHRSHLLMPSSATRTPSTRARACCQCPHPVAASHWLLHPSFNHHDVIYKNVGNLRRPLHKTTKQKVEDEWVFLKVSLQDKDNHKQGTSDGATRRRVTCLLPPRSTTFPFGKLAEISDFTLEQNNSPALLFPSS